MTILHPWQWNPSQWFVVTLLVVTIVAAVFIWRNL